jgi:pimeloyl-ACP methyl ester carboxylesterase
MNRHIKVLLVCFSIVFLLVGCGKKEEEPVDVAEKAAEPTITVDNAISADGVSIAYEVRGEGEPALVFVHGWSNNRALWDVQTKHFSQKYKVVTLDLAGFGESGSNRSDWTMQSFSKDVCAVVEKLRLEQVVLLGFSMGGPVVIEASKIMPERILGLVLVDILQDIEDKTPQKKIDELIANWREIFTDEERIPELFPADINPELIDKYIDMAFYAPKTGWWESIEDFFRWSNEECIESLQALKVPLMSINSDYMDTNVNAFQKYGSSYQLKTISTISHLVMWEAPDEFNRLLEEAVQEFVQMAESE